MKTVLSATLGFLLTAGVVAAAQDQRDEFQIIRFHRVHLRNGNVIDGNLIQLSENSAILKLPSGEMAIRRGMIEKIEYIKMRSLLEKPPVVDQKKVEEKKAPETTPSDSPRDRAFEPIPTPAGLSSELRERVDALIAEWGRGRSADRQLARDFEELGADILPYLAALLEQRTKQVPVAAMCAAIGKLVDPRAVPGLTAALHGGRDPEDRRQALLALARFNTPEIDKTVLTALEDPASTVWKEAKDYLVQKARKGGFDDLTEVLIQAMGQSKDKLPYAMTLGTLGTPGGHRELVSLLSTGEDLDKRAAMQGLSQRPNLDDGPEVSRYLNARDEMIRREACLYMGKVKYTGAVPELIQMLNDNDSGVKTNAHWALKEITSEKLAPESGVWQTWYDNSPLKKELQK